MEILHDRKTDDEKKKKTKNGESSYFCCSVTKSCLTLCNPVDCRCQTLLSFIICWNLPKFMSTKSVMLSSHLILGHPLLLLPSVFPSIRVFCNKSTLCIKWPKYWSFSISPSEEYTGFISLGLTGWISLQSKGLSRVFPAP